MAKYKLQECGGVLDTEKGHSIPADESNRHWREYLEWQAGGNTPDPADAPLPEPPAARLNRTDKQMIRAVDWLLEFMVTEGRVPTLPDIPQQLKALYLERKQDRES